MQTIQESSHTTKYASADDHDLLTQLRHHRQAHRRSSKLPYHPPVQDTYTFGQRIADKVASTVGSWTFILGLVLSFQAAYTAPAIMMSQNRQAAKKLTA